MRAGFRLALAVGAAIALVGEPAAARQPDSPGGCQLARVARLKFDATNEGYVVVISLNGKDVRMVADTGAEYSIVLPATRQRLGLGGERFHSQTVGGFGGLRGASVVEASDFAIGDMNGKRLALLEVEGAVDSAVADGILGSDIMSLRDADFDVGADDIGFFKAIGDCSEPHTILTGNLYSVDLEKTYKDVETPIVRVSVNNHDMLALVDSGSFETTLYSSGAAEAGIETAKVAGHLKIHGVGRSAENAARITIDSFSIGDLTIRNMPAVVVEKSRDDAFDLLLGRDFLQKVHVWISNSSHSMIMQYPPRPTPAP